MSLEKMCCKKCGAELVDGSKVCPNCGYSEKPVEPKLSIRQKLANLWQKTFWVLTVLLGAFSFVLPMDDDMYRGVFFIACILLYLIGSLFLKSALERIGCVVLCLIFIVLSFWEASKYDIYGENTPQFDKLKRSFYWLTPNFETSDNATMINDNAFICCNRLESVKISNGVKTIGASAFAYCKRLKRVEIGNGVTSIGKEAFASCSNLTDVEIGCGVVLIEREAFNGCRSLERITIPSLVASIEKGAFYNCTSLKDVYCEAIIPPTLEGNSVFSYYVGADKRNLIKCKIYVPQESVEIYKTAEVWRDFADRIEGYDF